MRESRQEVTAIVDRNPTSKSGALPDRFDTDADLSTPCWQNASLPQELHSTQYCFLSPGRLRNSSTVYLLLNSAFCTNISARMIGTNPTVNAGSPPSTPSSAANPRRASRCPKEFAVSDDRRWDLAARLGNAKSLTNLGLAEPDCHRPSHQITASHQPLSVEEFRRERGSSLEFARGS